MTHPAEHTLLIVAEKSTYFSEIIEQLKRDHYHIIHTDNLREATELLKEQPIPVILTPVTLLSADNFAFLSELQQHYPDCISLIYGDYTSFTEHKKAFSGGLCYKYLSSVLNANQWRAHIHEAFRYFDIKFSNKPFMDQKKSSHEAVAFVDNKGVIQHVNPLFCEILGYQLKEVAGKTINVLNQKTESERFQQKINRSIQQWGYWSGEVRRTDKTGETLLVWLCITAIYDGTVIKGYMHSLLDITRQIQSAALKEYQLFFDELTGIGNRSAFQSQFSKRLANAKKQNQSFGLLLIDIKGFSRINEQYGYPTGDDVLKNVAQLLETYVQEDNVLARLGDDEFAMLFPNIKTHAEFNQIQQAIHKQFKQPFHVDNLEISVDCSIGSSLFPQDGNDYATLMSHANNHVDTKTPAESI